MATKVVAHPDTRLIEIIEPPSGGLLTLDVVEDIYSPLKDDWLADPTLQPLRFPFRTFGDFIGVEQIGPFVFLDNRTGWRMQPYDSDHELSLLGNLVAESDVNQLAIPLWQYRSGRSFAVRDKTSAQARTSSGDAQRFWEYTPTVDFADGTMGQWVLRKLLSIGTFLGLK